MTLHQRNVFFYPFALLLTLSMSLSFADVWPSKPIKFVVPFAPGGANDLIARAAAEGASKVLSQAIVIDNKPGAGATIGADYVAKSSPDGYTFLISAAGIISNSMIKKTMPYKDSDLVPVAMIALAPSVIIVPANSPHQNIKDFISRSKSSGGLNFATAGTGSTPHFVAELLNIKADAKLRVIPYKSGSESLTAVISGQVDATSEASIVVLPFIKSGKVRALSTTWTHRLAMYPDIPTAMEQGFTDIQIAHWAGLHAPKGTPEPIVQQMSAAIDAGMKNKEIQDRLKAVGIEPIGGTRASFEQFIVQERARLQNVVKTTGMTEE
ncbi:MAG: tripartite tricarboxylate transporter substrate binding protein [Betaproteobacteria bacterium]|jgi:tripartite-type tricarboxylate transporter receptor subunit TctC